MMKRVQVRECGQEGCDQPASHTLLWDETWEHYCFIHGRFVVGIADIEGYITPGRSFRELLDNEMLIEKEEE